MEEKIRQLIRLHYPRQQNQIADAAGLSRAFMSTWMNGKQGIRVENFEAICAAVGISWSMNWPN